jgi:Pyruvate/2-oxoacid:ferredoxin oxidoreductase delta subunit
VADLCELIAKDPEALKDYLKQSRTLAACHPRAIKSLFNLAGIELPEEMPIVNLRKLDAAKALEEIQPGTATEAPMMEDPKPRTAWKAWFPVIDRERCTNCGQCLAFCLFSVYEKDIQGRVGVKNPQNCKTDCPACARVCPSTAIIFPKYPEGGPISGDEGRIKPSKPDLSRLLGKDPFQTLKNRARFSSDRDEEQSREMRNQMRDEFNKP